jgi:hypothetical protein
MKQLIITIDEKKLKNNRYITVEDIINKLEDSIYDAVDLGYWLEYIWNEFEYTESEEDIKEIAKSVAEVIDYKIKE